MLAETGTDFFPWSKSYETGHRNMDREHLQLVSMLNGLVRSIDGQQELETQRELLSRLIADAQQHFRHEEQWMDASEFPGAAEHKEIHQQLEQEMTDYAAAFNRGAPAGIRGETGGNCSEMLGFLKAWFANHLIGVDNHTGRWLASYDRQPKSPQPLELSTK